MHWYFGEGFIRKLVGELLTNGGSASIVVILRYDEVDVCVVGRLFI